ncbi:ABC transporter ATP-binding protein [Cupriavidus basilensis]|uniref:ABC transporter ATP-binding protein n=1 Tax=Cupriavidus basilensis TaxID=68895 RepID=A0ABT6APJ8_9BURK|nr:ABC transporter ATP-binding protein [Cupriavidus basilensis]MDF3834532.1 ABC transporter ATP-binding protein [Cupriavidus basilensis]
MNTAATSPLLEVVAVSKRYGSLTVTDNLSFSLAPGEALGVLGPNGAGKSTLFNLITGDVRPDAGQVRWRGTDITALPPSARCHRGIGRSYQVPHPFTGMTVFENVLVGAMFGGGMREHEADAHAWQVLERTGLAAKANRLAGTLTLLDRKRLELARALGTRPDLLLLDEIAGGLTDDEAMALVDTIRAIRAEGVSIIWIEHVVHALLKVVDRLMVIHYGALLTEGDPAAVMASREVREVYMGIESELEEATA